MDQLVSIIVPVYNAEKYVEASIKSVLDQTYQNLELILVDDGSRDASAEICGHWARKDARVKCVYQENAGVGAARNRGLELAAGEFIAFLDADDYLDLDFCEKMVAILGDDGEIAFCEIRERYPDGTVSPAEPEAFHITAIPSSAFEYWGKTQRRSSCATMYSRKILQGILFSETLAIGEDSLFLAKVIARAGTLIYCSAPMYNYRVMENSAYHGCFDSKKKSEIDAWLQICRVFPEGSLSKLSAEAKCAEISLNMIRNYVDDPGFDDGIIAELIEVYRAKLPQLVRYNRQKHRSVWKAILIGLMPGVFVGRQRGVKR